MLYKSADGDYLTAAESVFDNLPSGLSISQGNINRLTKHCKETRSLIDLIISETLQGHIKQQTGNQRRERLTIAPFSRSTRKVEKYSEMDKMATKDKCSFPCSVTFIHRNCK